MRRDFDPADLRQKWDVRITFDDGREYKATAQTETKRGAFNLALIDARMGSSAGTYAGRVTSWEAVPAEGVLA